jgi:hypothetical protein
MPNEYLSTLWTLWRNHIIDSSQVIQALALYDYQLHYLGNGGIEVGKENETIRYEYGKKY